MANYNVTECDWCGKRSNDSADERYPKHMEKLTYELTRSLGGSEKGSFDLCGSCSDRASTALYRMQRPPPEPAPVCRAEERPSPC